MFSSMNLFVRYTVALVVIPGVTPFYSIAWLVGKLFIWPFSKKLYRLYDNTLYGSYQKYLVFFFEYFPGAKVILYGDHEKMFEKRERVIYMSNHQCLIDWVCMAMLAERQGSSWYTRFVLKDSLKYIPLYGFHFRQHGYVYVKRGRFMEEDYKNQLSEHNKNENPLWVGMYPEGHRFDPSKTKSVQKSHDYAKQHDLPQLNHVFAPRIKAIHLGLEVLHKNLDAIYDVTLAFSSTLPQLQTNEFSKTQVPKRLKSPSYADLFRGGMKIHMHVRRIPINQIPTSEEKFSNWLIDAYKRKEKLLEDFYSSDLLVRGTFGKRGEISPLPLKHVLPFVFLYLSLFSFSLSNWNNFKIYLVSGLTLGTGTCLFSSLFF